MKYDETVLDEIDNFEIEKVFRKFGYDYKSKRAMLYCEIIEKKQDNYRWHDLRQNPGDLPRKYKEVIVRVKENNFSRTYYMVSRLDDDGFLVCKGDKVLAWKNIEPFEEK